MIIVIVKVQRIKKEGKTEEGGKKENRYERMCENSHLVINV